MYAIKYGYNNDTGYIDISKSDIGICEWNVSHTNTEQHPKTKPTVSEVLEQECNKDKGYEISLLDQVHYESVIVNMEENVHVLIKVCNLH